MPSHAAARTRAAVDYDFRRPATLRREHTRVLEAALGAFSRRWSHQLLRALRVPAHVSLEGLALGTYDEVASAAPSQAAVAVLRVGPDRRPGLLQVPLDAALEWVDRMLGGRGTPVPQRELTELEQELVGDLLGRVVADLGDAFAGTAAVELHRLAHSPREVMEAATAVLTARFAVSVDEHRTTAELVLPAESVVPALRAGGTSAPRDAATAAEEELQRALLDRAVQDAPVAVAVRLGPVPVLPPEVLGLAVGDLLPLHHPRTQPMDVVVGDRVLAQAVAGTNASRLAGLVVNVKENP